MNIDMKFIITRFLKEHTQSYAYFISTVKRLSYEQLWQDVGKGLPVANILCHVAEMEKFWIEWGLLEKPFQRDREIEFSRKGDLTGNQIRERLVLRRDRTAGIVVKLEHHELNRVRTFHDEEFSGTGILMHHLHHLGIHIGHIQMKEQILGTACF